VRDIDKTTGSEREVVGVYFCARRKVCVCVCAAMDDTPLSPRVPLIMNPSWILRTTP